MTSDSFRLSRNEAGPEVVAEHLRACDAHFVPPLVGRVEIDAYAAKIASHAERFEIWHNGHLVALVAAYCNAPAREAAHITNVSVLPTWHGRGLASRLLTRCLDHACKLGFETIDLEVNSDNVPAVALYHKQGFRKAGDTRMSRTLQSPIETPRHE